MAEVYRKNMDIGNHKRPLRKQGGFGSKESGEVKYLVPKKSFANLLGKVDSTLRKRISFTPNVVWFVACAAVIVMAFQLLGMGMSAKNEKKQIMGMATSAYEDINSASTKLGENNFQDALSLFQSAQNSLTTAQDKLEAYRLLTWAVPTAKAADNVLKGAYFLAEGGKNLTSALNLFESVQINKSGFDNPNLNSVLSENRSLLVKSLNNLIEADKLLADTEGMPPEYLETLTKGREQTRALIGVLEKLVGLEDLYLAIAGGSAKTYLLIFQNYDEMRATGGFIGTYGSLRFNQGKIERLSIESVYNFDGSFYKKIAAPGPFQPEIQKWGLRDANWFVDFPASARKLLEFYEYSKETADGVIAVTPKIFTDILELTGPIEMPAYNTVLTAENFQTMVQTKTSVEYDKILNQPKKFLSDFAPALLDRLSSLDKNEKLQLLQILDNSLREKHILLYSPIESVQDTIQKNNYSGAIKETSHDYFAVFNSNLGGTKTDLLVNQELKLESKILSDGSVLNKLTVSRQNNDTERNLDFMRILVPKGSVLLNARGFDYRPIEASRSEGFATDTELESWDRGELKFGSVRYSEEAGKTELAGWVETEPNSGKIVTVNYMLPYKIKTQPGAGITPYSILYQKQPGILTSPVAVSLDLGNFKAEWSGNFAPNPSGKVEFQGDSRTDAFWPFVLKHD